MIINHSTSIKRFTRVKCILLVFVIIATCCSCKKKYDYYEDVIENPYLEEPYKSIREKDPIRAKSDTIAYIEAYKRFLRAKLVYDGLQKDDPGNHTEPIRFHLIAPNGIDISNMHITQSPWIYTINAINREDSSFRADQGFTQVDYSMYQNDF